MNKYYFPARTLLYQGITLSSAFLLEPIARACSRALQLKSRIGIYFLLLCLSQESYDHAF